MAKAFAGKSLMAVLGAGLAVGVAQAEPLQSGANPFGAVVFEPAQSTVAADATEQDKDGEHKCGAEGKCGSSS